MNVVKLINYSAQKWNTQRYQPTLFLCDENETPFSIPTIESNTIICDTENYSHIILNARWTVASFGEITLMTGCLTPQDNEYNLNVELAKERLNKMEAKLLEWSSKGFVASDEFTCQYKKAVTTFSYVVEEIEEDIKARWADLSLSIAMPASEKLALEYADWGIQKKKENGKIKNFLIGSTVFEDPNKNPIFDNHYKKLFNIGTLPFYWARFEPEEGKPLFKEMDKKVDWLLRNNLKTKGHPLSWGHTVPDWVDNTDLELLTQKTVKRIKEVVGYYKGKVEYWDVINEIQHYLKMRKTVYTRDEAIELTRICAETTKQTDPQCKTIVNADDPFGEYMAWKPDSGFATYDYFLELEKKNVAFDIIGIQLYYGGGFSYCRDMFEISRYFDKYERFNKELHLTETGAPSCEGEDPLDSSHTPGLGLDPGGVEPWEVPDPNNKYWKASDAGFWHRPWDQSNQADWAESFYKVLMSKPFINAITWWGFSDAGQHFWNHGGLLDSSNVPKESYHRLMQLKNDALL